VDVELSDAEEGAAAGQAAAEMEVSETESEYLERTGGATARPKTAGGQHGLVGREIVVLRESEGKRCTVTVIKHDAATKMHVVKYADGKTQQLDLKTVKWEFATTSAPGRAGRQRSSRVVDSDEDYVEDQNKPPQRTSSKARGKRPMRRAVYEGDDDDDDDGDGDGDDDEFGGAFEDDDDDRSEDDLRKFQHDDPYAIKHLQKMRRQLLQKLRKLKMPENPLDQLIHELGGPSQVAELTGRQKRLVRDADGKTRAVRRNEEEDCSMDQINLHERRSFQDGKKLVAIISEAASSGISLQADRRCGNQRRRVHITLELPWSADQAIQQCGRTHRSKQVHGPEYCLMMTYAQRYLNAHLLIPRDQPADQEITSSHLAAGRAVASAALPPPSPSGCATSAR
jgi:hypothetical protein